MLRESLNSLPISPISPISPGPSITILRTMLAYSSHGNAAGYTSRSRFSDQSRNSGFSLATLILFASCSAFGCSAKQTVVETRDRPARSSAQTDAPLPQTPATSAISDPETELAWDFLAQVNDQGELRPVPPPVSFQPRPSTPAVQKDAEAVPVPPLRKPQDNESSGWLASVPGVSTDDALSNSNAQYRTEQDLLKAVSEFQRVATKDTYRFPLPKDVTGANVYKATLRRFQDFETKHPGAYAAIIAFTRGRAYEGLHAYKQALSQYQLVSQGKSRLKPEALQGVEALTAFQALRQRTPQATTAADYVEALDTQAQQWRALAQQYMDTPYAALALEEEERLDRAKVTFLTINRYRIEDGNESVILASQQLIDKHQESKNRYSYRIALGDFYFRLAQEYTAQNDPESLRFETAIFEALGKAALRHYAAVAQEDGIVEKLEAKGKLEALEAYMAKIGRLGR